MTDVQPEVSESTARAKRAWEEAWGNPVAAKQNWQRIAFVEAAAIILAVAGLVYLGTQPKSVLYVVERDGRRVEYSGPVKPATMDDKAWSDLRVTALERFIESWRTVTNDRAAQRADYDRAFYYVGKGSHAQSALNKWFEDNDPFRRAARGETVSVEIRTHDVEGDRTVGIWWEETTAAGGGQPPSKKMWRALITYAVRLPTAEAARSANPLGVLSTELSWNEVKQ